MDAEPRRFKRKEKDGEFLWSVTIKGPSYAQVHRYGVDYVQSPKKKRGCVGTFTDAARLRMLKTVAAWNWQRTKCGVFITLTTPTDCWPQDVHARNQARYLFFRTMEKHLGRQVGALWRIEWMPCLSGIHKRKLKPHTHIIVPGVRFIDKDLVKRWWKQCTGSKKNVVAWIDKLDSKKKHDVYIAKYCAKKADNGVLDYDAYLNYGGRHWGCHRKSLIPWHSTRTYHDISEPVLTQLQELGIFSYAGYRPGEDGGFTVFGTKKGKVIDQISQLCLESGVLPE